MRIALAIAVVLALGAAGAYAALGRGDELDGLKIPEVATESGRAHHFDVRAFAEGLQPPDVGRRAPPATTRCGCSSSPAACCASTSGRRTVALDLADRVKLGAEQGLLGIAFHPDFATDRRLYLHWSDPKGDTRVAEFRAGRDGTIEPEPLRELLLRRPARGEPQRRPAAVRPRRAALPRPRRRRRRLRPAPDGAGPARAARQDPRRRRPRSRRPRWDVVLTGLRNPWRFSFDAALGELWIGDVGQDAVEEIDRVLLELDEPPKNLGWSAFEGTERRGRPRSRRRGELVWPVAQYPHPEGCSVTGGVVYAGSALSAARPPLRLRRLLLGRAVDALRDARRAARPTSGASRPRSRASPTSGRRTTASCCSPRATARSTARCRPARGRLLIGRERVHGPVEPHAHAVARVPGGEAEPAAAQAQAGAQLEVHELVVAVEGALEHDGLGRVARRPGAVADRDRLRPDHDLHLAARARARPRSGRARSAPCRPRRCRAARRPRRGTRPPSASSGGRRPPRASRSGRRARRAARRPRRRARAPRPGRG